MKKHKKLSLGKLKIAKLSNTFLLKGGVDTNDITCEPIPIRVIKTEVINTCINTIATRNGDSLNNSTDYV